MVSTTGVNELQLSFDNQSSIAHTASFRSSIHVSAQSSTPRCSCGGELRFLATQNKETEHSVDEILILATQSIEYWPKLKNCRACFHGGLEGLLASYGKVVAMLEVGSEVIRNSTPPSAESHPNHPLNNSFAGAGTHPSKSPATTTSASTSADGAIPPVLLGEFRFDHEQN